MASDVAYSSADNSNTEVDERDNDIPEMENNVASSSPNYYSNASEITEKENLPQVASYVAYSSANNPITDIDQRECDIPELESNVASSSPNYYADASEIAQRAEIPQVASQLGCYWRCQLLY